MGMPKVAVGQDTPWGLASAFCKGNPMDGRFACATHGIASFLDRVELAAHVDDASDGPHLMAWRCRRDGETHGWTAGA